MKKIIKLMPDYQCWPLWWSGSHDPGNIDPQTLDLSKGTLALLDEWSMAYDAQLNLQDPANSHFFGDLEKEIFSKKGVDLWKQLIRELSPDYEVWYYHIGFKKIFKDPTKLNI